VKSLDFDKNLQNIRKAGQGAGKSGSYFFHSYDGKFIIKTMSSLEKKIMISIVDKMKIYFECT
jgi:hypothetical protein